MTVIPFRDQHKMQEPSNSWMLMIGLFVASAIITGLAIVGAVDLIRSVF